MINGDRLTIGNDLLIVKVGPEFAKSIRSMKIEPFNVGHHDVVIDLDKPLESKSTDASAADNHFEMRDGERLGGELEGSPILWRCRQGVSCDEGKVFGSKENQRRHGLSPNLYVSGCLRTTCFKTTQYF